MIRILSAVLAVVVSTATPAIAEEAKIANAGTMALAPSGEWAKTLADSELAELRGGFAGFSFSAALSVFITNLQGDLAGSVETNGSDPVVTGETTANVSNGQVSITTYVGGVSDFSGVLNIVSVPGSFNVVSSILNVNIALVTVADGAQVPNMQQLFGQ